ncbi:MAG: hypothetical protein JWN43_4478, partial [Gammaproteobacteria bacterium]|nr:hypothetical protein [Gammaproteobacteria bacterium]
LNLTHAAVAQEGFVVHSPSPASLLDALASAIAGNEGPPLRNQWRFVSNRSETIDSLAKSGAIAVHSRSLEAGQQYLAFKPDSPSLPLIENRASASEA